MSITVRVRRALRTTVSSLGASAVRTTGLAPMGGHEVESWTMRFARLIGFGPDVAPFRLGRGATVATGESANAYSKR